MIKIENAESLFQKLKNVLAMKQYPKEMNSEIIFSIIALCNLDTIDSDELERLIDNIINGLKNVKEVEINTRENLCKIPKIKESISLSTGGYVTRSKEKLVVVKENLYDITLVHELIHLTQGKEGYYLPQKYDYAILMKKALEEGEASYYQAMYTKQRVPSLVEGNYYITNITNRYDYNVFLEFYQDMRTLLGREMLEKWKSISKEEDFMIEIEKYMQEHYQCSIASFYQIWCVILYYYMDKVSKTAKEEPKEYAEELHRAKKYHEWNIEEFNFEYESIMSSLTDYPKYLKEIEEEINSYKSILESPKNLEESMIQFIKNENQQLRKYIEEDGYDDVAEEWEKDIQSVNLETYKEAVLNWKEVAEKSYKEILQSQQTKTLKKQELEYRKSFLVDPSLQSMSIEALENLKNQQLAYLLQRRNQIETNHLEDSSNKHI